MTPSQRPAAAVPSVVRRTVAMLATSQALAMTGMSLTVTVAALAGEHLAPDPRLATVPLALQATASTLATVPAALLMRRIGRRAGFLWGQGVGATGAALATLALCRGSFVLLAVGSALMGVHNAFWQYYRFAAAEAASDAFRSRAISLVLAGGVVAALLGPELAKRGRNWIDAAPFAGS
ncbi:MAG TPA: MFS transporter, partial [Deferrisomatales bacterium]|nr:MFS transporter [Deferrisomatales bacterium]